MGKVLDFYTADTDLALKAWRRAKKTSRRLYRKIKDIIIPHNQDGVYNGHIWLNEVIVGSKDHISYSEDGAKGNIHIEAFIDRFKDENRLIFWEQDNICGIGKGC